MINAVDYVIEKSNDNEVKINIYSDSQYAVGIISRKEKFTENNYLTKKGIPVRNADLVKELINHINLNNIHFKKVKAHQKKTNDINYNRKADKISRKIVRQYIKENL